VERARVLPTKTDSAHTFQSRLQKAQTGALAAPAPKAALPQEKPALVSAPAPQPAVTPAAAKVAPSRPVAAPKPAPVRKEPRPKKTFPNELPVSFEEAAKEYSGGANQFKGSVWLA